MRVEHLFENPSTKAAIIKDVKDAEERLSNLTASQRAILPMICDGLLNKQAAHALGLSTRTIENHRQEIMRRTECRTFAQLVKLYVLAG